MPDPRDHPRPEPAKFLVLRDDGVEFRMAADLESEDDENLARDAFPDAKASECSGHRQGGAVKIDIGALDLLDVSVRSTLAYLVQGSVDLRETGGVGAQPGHRLGKQHRLERDAHTAHLPDLAIIKGGDFPASSREELTIPCNQSSRMASRTGTRLTPNSAARPLLDEAVTGRQRTDGDRDDKPVDDLVGNQAPADRRDRSQSMIALSHTVML